MSDDENFRIAVIGLGYVGLPLAVEFGKKTPVIGFDKRASRVQRLLLGVDDTKQVSMDKIKASTHLSFTENENDLSEANVFIVTVPTPIDKFNRPDLSHLLKASESVAHCLKIGDIVIYESTVYPGATEEDCVPVLERVSGLKFNKDFFCGYSPERINPGDEKHSLTKVVKITSGSTPKVANIVDSIYKTIIEAGTHKAPSIRVAEAAKVIENTQRDINIALVNELSIIFDKLGLDTSMILDAAGTKWNFLKYTPGLVGGHCIGVDPYYLTHKAESLGYYPQVILSGRKINDGMASYVANRLVRILIDRGFNVKGGRALMLGLSFKENCSDLRNTKVVDVILKLQSYGVNVDVFDPVVDADEAHQEYGIKLCSGPSFGIYNSIVLAVPHDEFKVLGPSGIRKFGIPNGHVFFDVKSVFDIEDSDLRL